MTRSESEQNRKVPFDPLLESLGWRGAPRRTRTFDPRLRSAAGSDVMRDSRDACNRSSHQNATFLCDPESDTTPARAPDFQSGKNLECLFGASQDAAEVAAIHDLLRPRAFVLVDTTAGIAVSLALACLVTLALSLCLAEDERQHERTHAELVACEQRCPVMPEVVIEGDPRAFSRIDDSAVGP